MSYEYEYRTIMSTDFSPSTSLASHEPVDLVEGDPSVPMTKRAVCAFRRTAALVLAGFVPSKAWVPSATSTPISARPQARDADDRTRERFAPHPASHLRTTKDGTSEAPLVFPDEVMLGSSWDADLTRDDLDKLLETAQVAARAAGQVIRSNLGCCSRPASMSKEEEECEIKYSIKDIVTQYDQQAQHIVQSAVLAKFPTHRFLGEEDVAAGGAASQAALEAALRGDDDGTGNDNGESEAPSRSPFLWICDPIDGTANFASGLELCAVTMGVAFRGTPVVGVVYDPHRDEMYSAVRGHGATCNGHAIAVASSVASMDEAIVNAGCPADPNAFGASVRGIVALNRRCRGVRMIACSALTLAWIASGKLTAHFGYDLSSWDLIAGALLVQEAGGRITDLDGTPYRLETRSMLCSNGAVHDEILTVLTEADAVSFTRSL